VIASIGLDAGGVVREQAFGPDQRRLQNVKMPLILLLDAIPAEIAVDETL
tara:strand:+ start:7494 stop:7643 length:150 start_codon:yes stop_codon:yes gene_type:complete